MITNKPPYRCFYHVHETEEEKSKAIFIPESAVTDSLDEHWICICLGIIDSLSIFTNIIRKLPQKDMQALFKR